MDRERNEDLNPHGDDIEEKVRRLLDPSVPDEPPEPPKKTPITPPKPAVKPAAPDTPPVASAPSVPSKSGKTVSINVTHHDEAAAVPEVAPPVKKITITAHDETPADVAEKLNEAIAGLDKPSSKETPAPKPAKKAVKAAAEPAGEDNKTVTPDKAEAETNEVATAPPLPPSSKASSKVTVVPPAAELTAESEEITPPTHEEIDVADMPEDLPPEALTTIGDAIDKAADEVAIDDPSVLKDPATDKAVDDIMAEESDEILEIEDALADTDEPIKPTKPAAKTVAKPKKHRAGLGSIFKSRAFRWLLILLIIGGIGAAVSVPKSRYLLLNSAGVRAESSLTVLDDSTQQPLKNVQVSIGDATGTTDAKGEVTLTHVKLGPGELMIQKRAFAPVSKPVVIGWGSNPLQTYGLTPTGTQYQFTSVDYLSGKPVSKVEVSSNQADAISSDQGVIKLTLDKPADNTELQVTFKHDGYRDETQTISANEKGNHVIKLVPVQKDLFVSKRSGKYDVYSMYIDGKDEKVILAGTGTERDDMVLVPHPTETVAAYVSTRSNQHNSQGFLLSTLTIINTDDNTTHDVVAAERIQLIDWSDDNLVYVQIASGESANSPKRYRLMSYNLKTTATKELASSNYFNDVVSVGGDIYYAPSSAYQSSKTALYKVKADGSGAQTVFNQEVWNLIRTSYDHMALAVEQQWYDYRVGDKQPQKLNVAPSSQQPRVYINSPDGKHAAWVDVRDGKGVLLAYDTSTKNDATIDTKSGLTYPVRWLNDNVLVYRVKSDQETADYAVSLNGGNPLKIRDVTNAGGIDRWYYY